MSPQRRRHTKVQNEVQVKAAFDEYLSRSDWRVKANANQEFGLGGLILSLAGKMTAHYWLNEVYSAAVAEAHVQADFHIHDLDFLSGYCAGWSLRTLLREGFNGVSGRVESCPPRHLSSALGQINNFLGTLQNEWAGAQALSSFDTYLAPYIRLDDLSYEDVRQEMQQFVFNLNVPSRWGGQTPFTNLTFDWVCPEDLRRDRPMIGDQELDFTYGDLSREIAMINRAFLEVMREGDALGRVFTFPIPTFNLTPDFPWESAETELLFEVTAKYGLPYFQNFIGSGLQPNMIRAMCCRLQLDVSELLRRGNGLFGSAEQTGSIGVVTINCARLGYLHRLSGGGSWEAMLVRLDGLLELAFESLEVKRAKIDQLMQMGLFPFTRRYLGSLRNHFSTIGINGVNEMLRNFSGDRMNLGDESGREKAASLVRHVRAKLVEFQNRSGHMYNLEATPAEATTYRFAKEDRRLFPEILQAGTEENPYYTNSTQLPVGWTDDAFEALELQDELQTLYTGGTVLHLYMNERISSARACRDFVRRAVENFRLPYLTVTPTFSICPRHGYLSGHHEFCPKCDEAWLRQHQDHELTVAPRSTEATSSDFISELKLRSKQKLAPAQADEAPKGASDAEGNTEDRDQEANV